MSFDFSDVFDYGNFLDSLDSPFVLDLKNLVEASGLLTSSINSVDCLHSSDVFSSVNVSGRIAGDGSSDTSLLECSDDIHRQQQPH